MQLFKCCWMGSFFQMLWYHINHASSKCMYLLWIFPHLVILALLSWSWIFCCLLLMGFSRKKNCTPCFYHQISCWPLCKSTFFTFFWCIPWNPIDFYSVIFHWYLQQRVYIFFFWKSPKATYLFVIWSLYLLSFLLILLASLTRLVEI